MLPVPLLIALILAFGIDPPRAGAPMPDAGLRVLQTCGGISVVAILSFGFALWIASQVSQGEMPPSRVRRRHIRGVQVLTLISLIVYGWIIHSVGWGRVVRTNWGLGGLGVVNDAIVFLPFAVIQLVVWWGQFVADRAFQRGVERLPSARLSRYLLLRSRQSLGLMMPVVLLLVIRRDILSRLWPHWDERAVAGPIEVALLGGLVLAAPLFVRFAWPTRPLPPGPLRSRLERAARRAGFRFRDILLWDTGNSVLNACVTGVLPGFRYVLLTDALVDTMTPVEVAAVFGHEIGHIAHRHLLYFGFFFAGSLAFLTLLTACVTAGLAWLAAVPGAPAWAVQSLGGDVGQEVVILVLAGLYFWLVFGHLSRRFERQADVFGSKVVSCDLPECPPHLDIEINSPPTTSRGRLPLCPGGLRTFSEALAIVAQCNNMEFRRRSWRHGSIASRILFLQHLENDPRRERGFQREMTILRGVLGLILVLSLCASGLLQWYGR